MKPAITKHKKSHKNAYDTFAPLNVLLRIDSLIAIKKSKGNLIVSWSFTKTLLTVTMLICINITVTVFKIQHFFSTNTESRSNIFLQLIFLLSFGQYIVDLHYVHKLGRKTCLKYFKLYENFDNSLRMSYYNEVTEKIKKITAFFSVVGVVCPIFNYISGVISYGWVGPTLNCVDDFYASLNSLTVLDMSFHVMQIEYRLKMMADVLHDVYTSTENLPGSMEDLVNDKEWFHNTKGVLKSNVMCLKTLGFGRYYEIDRFKRCYIILIEQVNYINQMFGLRVSIVMKLF